MRSHNWSGIRQSQWVLIVVCQASVRFLVRREFFPLGYHDTQPNGIS